MSNLIEYKPGDATHEAMVFAWWMKLITDDEMKMLWEHPQSPGDLYKFFGSPRRMLFSARENMIWFTWWFEPFVGGAITSLWCDKERRKSADLLQVIVECIETGLKTWPVMLCMTDERIIDEAVRLGYNVVGVLPKIHHGEDLTLCAVTRESFRRLA